MSELYILHNGHDERSRKFVAQYQDKPELKDVIDILSEIPPVTNYPGCPCMCLVDGENKHVLFNPSSWEEVLTWKSQAEIVVKPTQYSKLDFLFLFANEWNNIKEAAKTNSQVSLIFDSFTMADFISMNDSRTIASLQYLVSVNLITQEKLDSILV